MKLASMSFDKSLLGRFSKVPWLGEVIYPWEYASH
jgi:hypothetical protein